MKKFIKLFTISFVLVAMLSLINVKAGEVTSLTATAGDGSIKVSGTTEASVNAVAIIVYAEDGTTLVKMVTTSVSDTNAYEETIAVDTGKYVVKVADYEGGDFKTANVTVATNSVATPNTLDNIVTYIIVGILAVAGITVGTIYLKRKSISK